VIRPPSRLSDRERAFARRVSELPRDPTAARRRLLALTAELAHAEFGGTYALGARGRDWFIDAGDVHGAGAARDRWLAAQLEPLPVPYDPEVPDARAVGRFLPLAERQTRNAVFETFYSPFGLSDQVRALFYDSDQFVGWMGFLRFADQPRFDRQIRGRLNRVAGAIGGALTAIRRIELADRRGAVPAHLVFSEQGRLLFASEGLDGWLTRERRRKLAELVRQTARGGVGLRLLSRAAARCHRMVGDGRSVFYVHLDESTIARRDPVAALSPRRREVAQYAAAGATSREIAETLGISHHTVRQHLKAVYRLLGVGHRVELAETLARTSESA